MTSTKVERLARLLGHEGAKGCDTRDPVWEDTERALGTRLPQDFKEVVSIFGQGSFDDFLVLNYPRCPNPYLDLETQMREMVKAYTTWEGGVALPYPFFPALGGIIPWGGTDNGDVLFWRTGSADPNDWTVVVTSSKFDEWHAFGGGAAAFLLAVLSGAETVPFFPEDFPSDKPQFRPLADERADGT